MTDLLLELLELDGLGCFYAYFPLPLFINWASKAGSIHLAAAAKTPHSHTSTTPEILQLLSKGVNEIGHAIALSNRYL